MAKRVLLDLFDWSQSSPFLPLREHSEPVRACVELVTPMFECVLSGEYVRLEALAKDVFRSEHEADLLKKQIRDAIPRTFSLPVFRGDLLSFLQLQDSIADSAEDLAVLLTIKQLNPPPGLSDDISAFVQESVGVCRHLLDATGEMAELGEADLHSARAVAIQERIEQIDDGEWQADKTQYRLAKALFSCEDQLKTSDLILWSDVLRELGTLANCADMAGERIRRMLPT